ncbi:MAG: hypothetical protein V5786_00395 [Psychromonas sp.]
MQEHGFFKMEIIKQTLIIECFDAWNIETVLRHCAEYKELVRKINDKPWASLVDLSQWELAIPEMWDEIKELNEWANINNQKFEAVICSLSLQKWLMKDSHVALTNVETRFFDNRVQAQDWLNSVL